MATFQTIEELNTYLSDNLRNLQIKEYIQKYHDVLQKDLDLSFMEYFLYLCEHPNTKIVEHEKLIEYGVFESTRSNDIKKRIDSIELEEGKDYQLRNVAQRGKSGAQIHKHYTLTPEAFKLCLMRSKKQIKYAKYYLFLEICVHYYQKYQELYTKVLLSGKDKKIDELIRENKEQSRKMDEQSKKIDEMLGHTKDIKTQNNDLKKEVHKVNAKLDKMEHYLKNVFQVIDNNTISMFQTNCIILYKLTYVNGDIKYFISSRQLIDIIKTCKEKQKDSSIQSIKHVKVFEPSNNIGLMKMIKQSLKNNKKIKIQYNTIKMDTSQEEVLIQTIENILHTSKFNVFEKMGIDHDENHINAYTYIYNALVDRMFNTYFQSSKDLTKKIIQDIYNKLKQELPKEE